MPNEGRRSDILTVGGVLAIISGVLGIMGGLVIAILAASASTSVFYGFEYFFPGVIGIILGALAILGGRRALARDRFGWAITGGICALLVGSVLGILALIFIAISKAEFE